MYGYGMGASDYAVERGGNYKVAADKLREQSNALTAAVNKSGMVKITGTKISYLVPQGHPGAQSWYNQALQAVNLRQGAARADAEAARIRAAADSSAAPPAATGGPRPTSAGPQPVATGPQPVTTPTGGSVYTGPTYQPGRIMASMPPPRQSSLGPLPPMLSIQSPQLALPPVSRGKTFLVLGVLAFVGAAYWIINRNK